jgi:hypothetical protein
MLDPGVRSNGESGSVDQRSEKRPVKLEYADLAGGATVALRLAASEPHSPKLSPVRRKLREISSPLSPCLTTRACPRPTIKRVRRLAFPNDGLAESKGAGNKTIHDQCSDLFRQELKMGRSSSWE